MKHAYKDSSFRISAQPKINALIISGTESDFRVIEGVIKILDTDENINLLKRQQKEATGTFNRGSSSKKSSNAVRRRPDVSAKRLIVFSLEPQKAEEVAKILKDVLKKVNASADYRISVDQKENRIFVAGTSSDLKMVEALIILLTRKLKEPAKSDPSIGATLEARRQKKTASVPKQTGKSQTSTIAPAATPSEYTKDISLKYHDGRELSTLLDERQMEIYLEMVFVKTGKGFRLL